MFFSSKLRAQFVSTLIGKLFTECVGKLYLPKQIGVCSSSMKGGCDRGVPLVGSSACRSLIQQKWKGNRNERHIQECNKELEPKALRLLASTRAWRKSYDHPCDFYLFVFQAIIFIGHTVVMASVVSLYLNNFF